VLSVRARSAASACTQSAINLNSPSIPNQTTRAQAIVNTLLSKVHIKKKAGFKPTDKTQAAANPFPVQTAFMARLTSLTRRFNQNHLPQLYEPTVLPPSGACVMISQPPVFYLVDVFFDRDLSGHAGKLATYVHGHWVCPFESASTTMHH
jgi:hypothetical protein